jgi:hypothetical protein
MMMAFIVLAQVVDATAPVVAPAPAPASASIADRASLTTTAPLGTSRWGMSIGGGVAVVLPFYAIEVGYGLARRVDLVARYETVVGVLHYPEVGARWAMVDIGRWTLGLRGTVSYSFFGIQTRQLNLTSTLYLTGELGLSGPVSDKTDLVFSARGEFDLVEYDVFDDESSTRKKYAYDATILKAGMKTMLTRDLDGYLMLRLRIPVETLRYEAQNFYVIPFIEVGGTWTWPSVDTQQ